MRLDFYDAERQESSDPLLAEHEADTTEKPRRLKEWASLRAGWAWRRLWRRRSLRRSLCCFSFYFVLSLVITFALAPFILPTYAKPPPHYARLEEACNHGVRSREGCANPDNEKVFITVALYDPQGDIAGGPWGKAVQDLIHMLGSENTFLSIYENDSGDAGSRALTSLSNKLSEERLYINITGHVSTDGFPRIAMPDGSERVKRLAYLSEMRNRALYPLDSIDPGNPLEKFDKVLILNDAIFDPLDAAHLLFNTNAAETPKGEAQYLAACALDYDDSPIKEYDMYAQRDADGYSMGIPIFPYVSSAGRALSRKAMLRGSDAVPVRSCWGSMVAMQAKWVQNTHSSLPSPNFRDISAHTIDPDAPRNITLPVRFRHEPELFFDACECCLFLADISTAAATAGEWALGQGVYINPFIRTSYRLDTFKLIKGWVRHWEMLLAFPQWLVNTIGALPSNNPHREVVEGQPFKEEVWNIQTQEWDMVERTGRSGLFCGVREMQTIDQDRRKKEGKNFQNHDDIPWESQQLDFPHRKWSPKWPPW